MASKIGTGWQKIKQYWRALVIVAIVLVVVIVLIFVEVRTYGTGFPGKTLWDWLQLLIIPLVLAVAALLFNLFNSRTERQIAQQRYAQDQQIALDKQQEDLLQAYLDRMSELLLEKQLHSPASPYEIPTITRDEVRNVARVRTITILFQLDARRIGYVFAFLREAGLMSTTSESIVSLKGANLTKINFSQAVIPEIDLRGTKLSGANLSGANLSRAKLSGADLSDADLSSATLSRATLSGASFFNTDLSGANLHLADLSRARLIDANLSRAKLIGATLSDAELGGATLSDADLSFADLSDADLSSATLSRATLWQAKLSGADLSFANLSYAIPYEATLSGANLSGANLREAHLGEAHLSGANLHLADLSGAKVTDEQLKQAKSLQGAIMPDGKKHP